MRKTETAKHGKPNIVTVLGGAGLMGSGIVRDLISDFAICEFAEIRICDLATETINSLVQLLDDPRLKAWPLDVSDRYEITKALDGADLCINAVPTLAGFQMSIFEAALNAGCHYIDLGGLGIYTREQLEWRQQFRTAGVTAVISTGADPGMSNMLCRAVADELDTIEKINLYWAAELIGDENPVLVPPYSISTVLAEYAKPSIQFFNGVHVECEPMTGNETLQLDEPWGRTEFMYSPHSEQLTVPLAKGIADKGIQEFTWKLHLPDREHEAWVGLVKAGFGDFDQPVDMQGVSIKPIDFLSAIINRNIDVNADRIPVQESHEIHFAVGEGIRNGKQTRVRWQVAVHPHELFAPYVDAATSMNASISAQLLLNAEANPGVWAPEEYFDAASYFREVDRRQMVVGSTIETLD